MTSADTIPCPICKKPVSPADDSPARRWFPFCCQRCSLVDLGRWLDGKYQIAAEIDPDEDRSE